MIYCVETFAVAAALLADLLLGNYGFTPCLALFVLFHASVCVSLRFGIVEALIAGVVTDLLYSRASAWTPVLFTAALLAGRAALFRRDGEKSRGVLSALLPGAAIGAVMALGELPPTLNGIGNGGWFDVTCRLSSGVSSGALSAVLVLTVMDALNRFLGLPGFFRPAGPGLDFSSDGRKRRVRRVRAANMVRRNR